MCSGLCTFPVDEVIGSWNTNLVSVLTLVCWAAYQQTGAMLFELSLFIYSSLVA